MTLDDLRKIAEAATKGSWEWERPSEEDWPQHDQSLVTSWKEDDGHPATVLHSWGYDASGIEAEPQDRLFIATFNPERVLELLDQIEQLQTRLAAVEKLHPLVEVYDECDHENCTADPVEVYDYTACTDSLLGYACRNCCFQNSDYMAESCSHDLDHDDTTRTTYCPTIKAVRGE